MSGPAGGERVFPRAGDSPPGPPSPGSGGGSGGGFLGSLKRVDKKVWMGFGAVVVAGLALLGRGPADGAGEEGADPYELDTTDTDLYGELQPELEAIGDGISDLSDSFDAYADQDDDVLSDSPSAPTPAPARARKPRRNRPGPKPARGKPGKWTAENAGKPPKGSIPGTGRGGRGGRGRGRSIGTGPRRPAIQRNPEPRPAPRPKPRRGRGR